MKFYPSFMLNSSVLLYCTLIYCLNYILGSKICPYWGCIYLFFSWPGAGLTNRLHIRDSRAGAPLCHIVFGLYYRKNIVPNWWHYYFPTCRGYTVINCYLGVIMLWQVHECHIAKSDFPQFPDVVGWCSVHRKDQYPEPREWRGILAAKRRPCHSGLYDWHDNWHDTVRWIMTDFVRAVFFSRFLHTTNDHHSDWIHELPFLSCVVWELPRLSVLPLSLSVLPCIDRTFFLFCHHRHRHIPSNFISHSSSAIKAMSNSIPPGIINYW